ncbi:MAG: glycoside hydrolase family 78 protein [Clostridiales bacterium]|nr:glycoside hydrolase family 78 protein [Clostridiales bacterium]
MIEIYDCTTEHLVNPVGIDAMHPRFSWKLRSDQKDIFQTAYQISALSAGLTVWDSGLISNGESRNIRYEGAALKSGQRVTWTVTVWAGGQKVVSEPACFEMGLLSPDDWKASWVQPETEPVDYDSFKPVAYLRKAFSVKPGLVRAKIYQSAHGLYEFWLNGRPGSKDVFKPGLTSYHTRTQYQVYDVTALLNAGENVWAITLADGWWRGSTGGGNYNNYGFYTHFIGQLVLEYDDGTTEYVVSDPTMKHATGGLRYSDMKAGDLFDARLEPDGWKLPEFHDDGWEPVALAKEFHSIEQLVPSRSVPVREKERFPATILRDGENNLVLDFGQNIAGYVSMVLRGCQPGQEITLCHGEGLKNGVFSTDNVVETTKDPFQQVTYICKGAPVETYCPLFSVFGFRYVKLSGYDGEIQPGDFTAIAVYSDLQETGRFSCSNPLINQLVSNCRWSQKGNFLDVPTDCPTRERSSWSGDSQVYCRTAADFMDVYPFFEKWLRDLSLEQFEDGCVGNTFPATLALHNPEERQRMIDQNRFVFAPPSLAGPSGERDVLDGSAGWGDTATITPMTMYLCYGDKTILEQQYESAKRWSLYQRNAAREHNPLYEDQPQYHQEHDGVLDADYIFDTRFHWGEWLEPDAIENGGPDSFSPPEMAKKGNPLVATAYLYYSSVLVAQMAEILGKEADAADFTAYAGQVKRVYNRYFIQEDGTILAGRQAPYVRTLAFDLADDGNREKVAAKLAEAVEQNGYKLNTGFLSTPYLLEQLCRYGYTEHAFRILEQTESPSWLHPVKLGATTILESWTGLDVFNNSFNHYSYGAVCDFLFSNVAGIQPTLESPGYREIILRPTVGGTLTYAEAEYESACGLIRAAWKREADKVHYHFELPANTSAQIILPDGRQYSVGNGSYDF